MLLIEFYKLPLISPKSYHTLPVPMRPDGCALQKKINDYKFFNKNYRKNGLPCVNIF